MDFQVLASFEFKQDSFEVPERIHIDQLPQSVRNIPGQD